jgi:hypothetical protein
MIFDFHPTSNFGRVFCRYGFKEQTLFYYTNPYKYPLSLQLVLEPTISCFYAYFLAIMAIHVDNFNLGIFH